LATLAVAVSMLPSSPAKSGETVTVAIGAGPAARDVAGHWNPAFAPELTLHVPFVSCSTGASVSSDGLDYAYGEVSVHPLLSLGGGLGYGAYAAPVGRRDGLAGHLLVGLPIPLVSQLSDLNSADRMLPYLSVFYRPSWGPWPGTAHELGVMLKFSRMPGELRYHGKGR
jgi:hypothetical protein